MNPPNDPPEVNVNGQTANIERPQTSAAIAGKILNLNKYVFQKNLYK